MHMSVQTRSDQPGRLERPRTVALFFFAAQTERQWYVGHTGFVIQSLPRCGAGLVMSALARHPECRVAGVLFDGTKLNNVVTMRAAGHWKLLYEAGIKRDTLHDVARGSAAGFISYRVPNAMQAGRGVHWEWSQTLWQYITDRGADGVKVISIFRDDPIARAISAAMALKTGVTAAGKHTDALRMYLAGRSAITIQPWLFRYFLEEQELAEDLPMGRVSTYSVYYEDMLEDWRSCIGSIQEFLGLTPVELTSPLAKLGKTPPHTLVANWDLLVDSFRSTRWEQHFERYVAHFLPIYNRQLAEGS